MTVAVRLTPEQTKALYKWWRSDYDEEGYSFPFIDMWVRYRLKAEMSLDGSYHEKFATIFFHQDVDAVEFKLKYL